MTFNIHFTREAAGQYQHLPKIKIKKVKRVLGYLQTNPRHPSLNTHVYHGYENPFDSRGSVFEAYVENETPGAHRMFWCYGPKRGDITIIAIIPHP
ncbi:MAG: hypothetical protein HYU97_05695 [Deltaproteobacteria bacterium]|nr:hypothetical protein [Deltaproteobacteria bacterium]